MSLVRCLADHCADDVKEPRSFCSTHWEVIPWKLQQLIGDAYLESDVEELKRLLSRAKREIVERQEEALQRRRKRR